MDDVTGIGAALATLYAFVEGAKHFGYKKVKNGNGRGHFTTQDREMLKKLDDWTREDEKERISTKFELKALNEQLKRSIEIQKEMVLAIREAGRS